MGLFGKRTAAPLRAAGVSLYGKHPGAGDFLRLNAGSPALRSLDDWLSAALAAAQRVPEWAESYGGGTALCFVYLHAEKGGAAGLLGALAPSSDRSGRQFPLVIYSELELEATVREQPWLAGSRFLGAALELLDRRASLGKEALLEAASTLAPPAGVELEEARVRLSRALQETTCGGAFQGIFGGEAPDQAAGRAIGALEEACRTAGSYAVACPLGPEPALGVAIWMRLVQALTRGKLIPGMLWSDRLLLLFPGRFTPRALLALWKTEAAGDDLYDLRTARAGSPRRIPADRPLAEWLSELR